MDYKEYGINQFARKTLIKNERIRRYGDKVPRTRASRSDKYS